jgi:hypothetical protein
LTALFLPAETADPGAKAVQASIEEVLADQGFIVAKDSTSDYDLRVTCETQPVANRVRARLVLTSGGHLVDEIETAFVVYGSEVTPGGPAELRIALRTSARLAQFSDWAASHRFEVQQMAAQERREDAARASKLREEQEAAAERAREEERAARIAEEDSAWHAANPERCTAPARADACEGVSAFLVAHPDSRYADEGRQLLANAASQIAILRDDEAWAGADVITCQHPTDEGSCSGVHLYLGLFPDGRHAKDARGIERRTAPQITRLRALRERREEEASQDTFTGTSSYAAPGVYDSGYGAISKVTGLPRTHYVHDYYRSNGTHVRGYFRSHR